MTLSLPSARQRSPKSIERGRLLVALVWTSLLGCGGEVNEAGSSGSGGNIDKARGGAAAFGGAFTVQAGGAASTVSSAACPEDGATICVSTCSSADPESASTICDASGAWQCPVGYRRLQSCPSDSCARWSRQCCDPKSGATTWSGCAADGTAAACPSGTRETNGDCIPDDLTVTDCRELDQKPCSSGGELCRTGVNLCTCTRTEGSGMGWQCAIIEFF
jgi:hypothetical protein